MKYDFELRRTCPKYWWKKVLPANCHFKRRCFVRNTLFNSLGLFCPLKLPGWALSIATSFSKEYQQSYICIPQNNPSIILSYLLYLALGWKAVIGGSASTRFLVNKWGWLSIINLKKKWHRGSTEVLRGHLF